MRSRSSLMSPGTVKSMVAEVARVTGRSVPRAQPFRSARVLAPVLRSATALTALLVVLAAIALPTAAEARKGQPVWFDAGAEVRDPGLRGKAFAELDSLGVRALRVVIYWRDVAPKPKRKRKPKVNTADPGV